jgi:hypothetical protein
MSNEIAVRERFINLKAWEVQAFLAGKKTRIARPIKPQPEEWANIGQCQYSSTGWSLQGKESGICDCRKEHEVKCPFQVGDVLYGRETWAELTHWENFTPTVCVDAKGIEHNIVYCATCPDFAWTDGDGWQEYRKGGETPASHWRPSSQMQKWASRLPIEITHTKVIRMQEVSEEEAIALGCRGYDCWRHPVFGWCSDSGELPTEELIRQWNADYPQYPYESNPWAWSAVVRVAERR